MAMTVPPIRKSLGWKPAERIPTTFPRECLALLYHASGRRYESRSAATEKLRSSVPQRSADYFVYVIPARLVSVPSVRPNLIVHPVSSICRPTWRIPTPLRYDYCCSSIGGHPLGGSFAADSMRSFISSGPSEKNCEWVRRCIGKPRKFITLGGCLTVIARGKESMLYIYG